MTIVMSHSDISVSLDDLDLESLKKHVPPTEREAFLRDIQLIEEKKAEEEQEVKKSVQI